MKKLLIPGIHKDVEQMEHSHIYHMTWKKFYSKTYTWTVLPTLFMRAQTVHPNISQQVNEWKILVYIHSIQNRIVFSNKKELTIDICKGMDGSQKRIKLDTKEYIWCDSIYLK